MKTVSFSNSIVVFKVLNHSEILIIYCFQRFKDTKKKANHNPKIWGSDGRQTVFNDSKILKRKLITTYPRGSSSSSHCFQRFKDTKKKANHNILSLFMNARKTVFNDSKILKRKLITTLYHC